LIHSNIITGFAVIVVVFFLSLIFLSTFFAVGLTEIKR